MKNRVMSRPMASIRCPNSQPMCEYEPTYVYLGAVTEDPYAISDEVAFYMWKATHCDADDGWTGSSFTLSLCKTCHYDALLASLNEASKKQSVVSL